MKVALVILHADPSRGGAERYTTDLAVALSRRGHDVCLLATSFGRVPESVRAVNLNQGGLTRASRYRRLLDALDSHVRLAGYDIVHSMMPVRNCDVYQPHAGIEAENLVSSHLKESHPLARRLTWVGNRSIGRRKLIATVEREMLSSTRPPIVLCLSNAQKQIVLEHYPQLGPHLVRLFNAVDLNRFSPAGRDESRRTVRQKLNVSENHVLALLISQNWDLKGARQAIEAVARARIPNLVLALVGRDRPSPYRSLAKSLGIEDQVRFPGPTSDAPAFYRAADFFVLPTRSDVCSLVVLEALATGLPVISTAANGACEIMIDGQHGFVLSDPNDVDALSKSMQTMLDPSLRSRMSSACLDLRSNLSYEHHLDSLIEVYGKCVLESGKLPSISQ